MTFVSWTVRIVGILAAFWLTLLLSTHVINTVSLYLGLGLLLILDACILYYAARMGLLFWRGYRAWRYLEEYEATSLRYCLRKRLTLERVRQAHALHRQVHRSGDEMNYCQLTIKDFLEETR